MHRQKDVTYVTSFFQMIGRKKYITFFILLFLLPFSAPLIAEERAQAAACIFKKYERPFTVLDLTNSCIEWAPDYPNSCFVLMSPSCHSSSLEMFSPNFLWLKREVIPEDIYALSACEHVDVMLVGDFVCRFPEAWKELIYTLQKMAHVILFEVPRSEHAQFHTFLLEQVGIACFYSEHNVYYILENPGPFPLKKSTLLHPCKQEKRFEVICDYSKKVFKKIYLEVLADASIGGIAQEICTPWIAGINFLTYIIFNGQIPTRSESIEKLPIDLSHTDWMPHNMILQGSQLLLIDGDDPTIHPLIRFKHNCVVQLPNIKKLLSMTVDKSPLEVLTIFTEIYGYKELFRLDTH